MENQTAVPAVVGRSPVYATMLKTNLERESSRLLYNGTLVLIALAVTTLIGAWTLLNRYIARGDKLQAQLNEFLLSSELPGRIDVFWYDNRVFVYSPVTDARLPDLMVIIDSAEWVCDIDLRNTAVSEAGSDELIESWRKRRRVLTPWNSEVTPFLYD